MQLPRFGRSRGDDDYCKGEYRAWLEEAGFLFLERVVVEDGTSIIRALKPEEGAVYSPPLLAGRQVVVRFTTKGKSRLARKVISDIRVTGGKPCLD